MKVIVGDVVIETDGPILITPNVTPPAQVYLPNEPVVVEPVESAHKRRSPRRRNTLVCRGCGISFRGRKNQMFHDSYCKQQFYRRMKSPKAEPLGIHAGATGVQVRP